MTSKLAIVPPGAELTVLDRAFDRHADSMHARAIYAVFRLAARTLRISADSLSKPPPAGEAAERVYRSRVPDLIDAAGKLEAMGAEMIEEIASHG